jgi:hypothetical protein
LDHLVSELGRDDIRPIASKTNVNVGSIWSNSIDLEFFNFTRVGSIKISLFPYVAGHSEKEPISELHAKLTNSAYKEKAVSKAIRNAEKKKTCQIDLCRMTGVTCAATTFPVM